MGEIVELGAIENSVKKKTFFFFVNRGLMQLGFLKNLPGRLKTIRLFGQWAKTAARESLLRRAGVQARRNPLALSAGAGWSGKSKGLSLGFQARFCIEWHFFSYMWEWLMLTWRVLNSNTVPGTVLLMPAVNSQKLMSTKSSSIAASTSILTFLCVAWKA